MTRTPVELRYPRTGGLARYARGLLETAAHSMGPVSYPDLDTARAATGAPGDATYVTWQPGWTNLEQAFRAMGANDILVLPEREEPYWIETQWGFPAAGVSEVQGLNADKTAKRIPISPTWNGMTARTWFAMCRARRGILGMGPGAKVRLRSSAWSEERQIEDAGSPLAGGGTSPGRYWWNLNGTRQGELIGAQEKVIETESFNSFFGNFDMKARDLGGIAFAGIAARGGTFKDLDLDSAWRGFLGLPNGETGAIQVNGGAYLISRVKTNPVTDGVRVGSSPIMINNSPGGRWEYGEASMAKAGMPTIWRSSGKHVFHEVTSRWGGPGVNLEQCADGFEFEWTGGKCWPNRANQGGHPSPDGYFHPNVMHIAHQALGASRITVTDVDFDNNNLQPEKFVIQLYSTPDPTKVKARVTRGGIEVPVVAYGSSGPTPIGTY